MDDKSIITKPTVLSLLKNIDSAIALDIAPLHTGIVIWNGTTTEEYYFKNPVINQQTDASWEFKLRLGFKTQLLNIVKGRTFKYCIVEDVFGGENYNTVRELLALNTVIDEIIYEQQCNIETLYRWKATEWNSKTRKIYKQANHLKAKVETQNLLEYLEYKYYLDNKDKTLKEKKDMCFEDICDSCGMLIALVAELFIIKDSKKNVKPRINSIQMKYIEHLEDLSKKTDKLLLSNEMVACDLNVKSLKESILQQIMVDDSKTYYCEIPTNKLGAFGIEQKFRFYASGKGYLVFCRKKGKR